MAGSTTLQTGLCSLSVGFLDLFLSDFTSADADALHPSHYLGPSLSARIDPWFITDRHDTATMPRIFNRTGETS